MQLVFREYRVGLEGVVCAETPAARRISAEFEKLKSEMKSIVPYGLDADLVIDPEKAMKKKFSNIDAANLRTRIARWICELN